MAFEGDLTNLGLADIFQTLGMNRQSGTLVVKYGDTERRFFFSDEGVSLLTSRSARKFRLGNLLVGMGKLKESDLKVAVLKQERSKDTKLGDILVQTELVKEADIKEACKYQAAEEIYESFSWKAGKFQFLEGANAGPTGGPGPFAEFFFSVTDIVMEAARRADEFALNLQKIGETDEFFVRKDPLPPAEDQVGRTAVLLHGMLDGTMDVKQVFEEFHLSAFDTSGAFVVLLDGGLIQPVPAAQLQEAAKPFLEKKEYPRAVKLLARAVHHDPLNAGLLQSLAEAQAANGDRKAAAQTFARLGKSLSEGGQRTEAVEALHKATQSDAQCLGAYELLMEVHAGLDQFDKSEDACREAARLLNDDRNFQGALQLIERGLALVPESLTLRLSKANALLGLGQKEDGIREMSEVAQAMEERKADLKALLNVYRKLEQIDPGNASFKEKVQDLIEGEKRRATRKKLLRVGAVVGGVAVVGIAFAFRPATAGEKLDAIAAFVDATPSYESDRAGFDEAALKVEKIAASADPDSEVRTRAFDLSKRIDRKRSAKERVAKIADLEKRIRETILKPATDAVAAGDYAGGLRRLPEVKAILRDPASRALESEEFSAMSRKVLDEAKRVVLQPSDALKALSREIALALGAVGAVDKLQDAPEERQRTIFTLTEKALQSRGKYDWKETLDAMAEVVKSLGDVEGVRIADLQGIVAGLPPNYEQIEWAFHECRANLDQREVRSLYSKTNEAVHAAKSSGDIGKGIEACEAFIARCDAIRKEEPAKFYEPVLKRLFVDLKLDKSINDALASLLETRKGLERAKDLESRGDIQGAFNALRRTIQDAQDVNFQGLALLPLRIQSRPEGATVSVTRPGQEPIEVGKTPVTLRYDYQGKTVVRVEMKGFEPAVLERTGIAKDREADVTVDLQRTLRWRKMAGASVEGRPGLAPGLVLVGTRGGLLRAFSSETGDDRFQLKTDHLSGISSGILVDGGSAYFGGNDGEAFAVDLAKQAFRWRKKVDGPASATPVVAGPVVVFADSDGKVYGMSPATGDAVWKQELRSPLAGDPVAAGELVLVAVADSRVVALKAADGSVAWTASISGPAAVLALDGAGGVLAGTEASSLDRVEIAGGRVSWSWKADGAIHARPVMRPEGILAVTTSGTVALLDPATGKERKVTPLGTPLEGGCAVHGDLLYAAANDGVLVAFDLRADRVSWRLSGLGQLHGEPAVGDGVLVVASAESSGAVFATEP